MCALPGIDIREQDITCLGALECTSSCVMTALAAFGQPQQHFLLRYWDLNFYRNYLITAKDARYVELFDLFGVAFHGEDYELAEHMIEPLRRGALLLFRCRASKLPFFPAQYVNEEFSDFDHLVLLVDYDSAQGRFHAVDPIAGYQGPITAAELACASRDPERFNVYLLHKPDPGFVPPTNQEKFGMTAATNYRNMITYPAGGLKSFRDFEEAFVRSGDWDQAEREKWIHMHNVTIGTTVKTRKLVWESIRGLQVLNREQTERYDRLFQEIVSAWVRLNFVLVRHKKQATAEGIEAFGHAISKLHDLERAFIVGMYEISRGAELGAG